MLRARPSGLRPGNATLRCKVCTRGEMRYRNKERERERHETNANAFAILIEGNQPDPNLGENNEAIHVFCFWTSTTTTTTHCYINFISTKRDHFAYTHAHTKRDTPIDTHRQPAAIVHHQHGHAEDKRSQTPRHSHPRDGQGGEPSQASCHLRIHHTHTYTCTRRDQPHFDASAGSSVIFTHMVHQWNRYFVQRHRSTSSLFRRQPGNLTRPGRMCTDRHARKSRISIVAQLFPSLMTFSETHALDVLQTWTFANPNQFESRRKGTGQ